MDLLKSMMGILEREPLPRLKKGLINIAQIQS